VDPVLAARVLLPVAGLLHGLFGLLWPILRTWRRSGVFAVTTARNRDPLERAMHVGLVALVGTGGVFALLYAALGPARLGLPLPGLPGVILGALFFFAGGALVVVAQAQMGRSWRIGIDPAPTALVTTGLYRLVRSPIYTGLLTFLLGYVALVPAWPLVAVWVVSVALLAIQARREEAHLARQHPEAFAAWAARTGRFLPGVGRVRR
jgi:protein-S-isoprenylcysteine O-methyltransferase Ste14